jgi:hypothetical protein
MAILCQQWECLGRQSRGRRRARGTWLARGMASPDLSGAVALLDYPSVLEVRSSGARASHSEVLLSSGWRPLSLALMTVPLTLVDADPLFLASRRRR